jgi:hypothetical protein
MITYESCDLKKHQYLTASKRPDYVRSRREFSQDSPGALALFWTLRMAEGYIKLHRKMLDWEWANDPLTTALFIRLLLLAQYHPLKYHGIDINRGELITGLESLSENTGISVQSLRTCLRKLITTKEITRRSTNKFSIITICNYDKYQIVESVINKLTNKQLTGNQQATNNIQEVKEGKKEIITPTHSADALESEKDFNPIEKGGPCSAPTGTGSEPEEKAGTAPISQAKIIPPLLEWVQDYCKARRNLINPQSFFDHYETNGWRVGTAKAAMKNWQASIRTWEARQTPEEAARVRQEQKEKERIAGVIEKRREMEINHSRAGEQRSTNHEPESMKILLERAGIKI